MAVDRDKDTEQKPRQRTPKQNSALHLFLAQISDLLNDSGLDIKKTLASNAEVPWTPATVKELLWRPLMKAVTGKDSTTQLTTKEIDLILDTVARYLGQNHSLTVEFPSIEQIIREKQARERE